MALVVSPSIPAHSAWFYLKGDCHEEARCALATLPPSHLAALWATTQTVTLSVPGMNCATCPITVKKALTRIGRQQDRGEPGPARATVTFDDARPTSRP